MYRSNLKAGLSSLFVSACLFTTDALAQFEEPLIIPNMEGEMVLDGNVDEAAWRNARSVSLDIVTRPFVNTQAPVATEVKIIENSEVLYVAFLAQDPNPEHIRAYYRDRDKVWSNDLVGVKLDTFNDSRLAYQFFANPYGIQADSIENEMTGNESDAWDGIWQSAGKITDNGYQVEMAIPLRILNFKEGGEHKIWGADFIRYYPREERLRISNIPLDRDNSCNLCQLADVSGFQAAKQSSNVAWVPTLVLGKGRTRDPVESLEWEDFDNKEVGLDVKWGITPELSLLATINPDFSQVESDVAQLSINNTFALFFDEKRPFFLENADYFSSNYNLVYTRNIGAPDYGAKITGRVDEHTLGMFVANDEETTFIVPGNLGSSIATIEEESVNVALRYRYDYSEDLSFGVTSTLRDADQYHNYLVAVDGKYQITDTDTLRVQYARSETQYPIDLYKDFCDSDCLLPEDYSEAALRLKEDDEFSGSGFRINYRHESRNWMFRADHFSNDENLRADLGFVNRADSVTSIIGGRYRWYSDNSWWNRIHVYGDWDIRHSADGEFLQKEAEIEFGVSATMQSFFEIGFETRDKVGLRIDQSILQIDDNTTLFTEDDVRMYFEIRPLPNLYFEVFARYGDRVDFLNNRLGKQLNIEPEISWDIGKHLQLVLRHTYRDFDVENEQLFTANLTDARLTYQFDQKQFLRLILVYSDIERNRDNYLESVRADIDAQDRSIGTQLLYSYKVNPLTKFFIGYSDSAYRDDTVTTMTKTEKSVFMKVSYAWFN